jgi:PPM family protein phosphatase
MAKLTICGMSDPGRKRSQNEDNFIIGNIVENKKMIYCEIPIDSSYIWKYGLLVAVADGMGGHNAGDVASDLALSIISRYLALSNKTTTTPEEIINILRNGILSSHKTILDMSVSSPNFTGMGSTIAGLYFVKDAMYTFHAGDSRVYRFRHGGLLQITKDHSFVQTLIDTGNLSAEDAPFHPDKNIITNSLGAGESKCNPEITNKYGYFEGDIFLVCSDGLTDMVEEDDMCKILMNETSLKNMTNQLILSTNENGGEDNISAVLIRIDSN